MKSSAVGIVINYLESAHARAIKPAGFNGFIITA